jgi:hypothetical protein
MSYYLLFTAYCRKGTFSNITSGACEVCPVTHDNIPTECTVCSDRSSHCLGRKSFG